MLRRTSCNDRGIVAHSFASKLTTLRAAESSLQNSILRKREHAAPIWKITWMASALCGPAQLKARQRGIWFCSGRRGRILERVILHAWLREGVPSQ